MKKRKILVTSALPYANGPLHLGHIAGAYLPADIYVRYQRLKGQDVLFICGSDEHGVPITVSADQEGVSPQVIVDRYHAMNKEAFERLGMSFDNYSRTSLPLHHETAQAFFLTLYRQGDLVVKTEKQFYSEKSDRFLPDRYVEGICPHCGYDKARGDQCDKCGKWLEPKELIHPVSKIDGSRPILKETHHWYFPMGRFAEQWKAWFDAHSWKENVRNYCMGWYAEGLGDRPITRDLHWGVPVPLEEAKGKVLYVWFDAPIGYISSTKEWAIQKGDPDLWKAYWCDPETELVHFIGKDNIVFHAILFPMMLMRVGGYVLPRAIPANEYLTIEGRKISTSQNYAIWVKDYLDRFPPDPLRYTLAANAPETKDTDFSWKQFQTRNNDELADILGNFIHRTLTFVHRYYEGRVPPCGALAGHDQAMRDAVVRTTTEMGQAIDDFEIRKATRLFMDLARTANKYFNDAAPWDTRKSDPAACATTLHVCVQTVHALSILMAPIMPFSSERLRRMLQAAETYRWEDAAGFPLREGHPLAPVEILFSKIEDAAIEAEIIRLNAIAPPPGPESPRTEMIDLEAFRRIEMKTGRVVSAERVSGTDRLLKLLVDLGEEKRQIVAGLGPKWDPDGLVGKTVIVVANLKPAVIHGIRSEGMLLAVRSGQDFCLLGVDGEVPPGLRVE